MSHLMRVNYEKHFTCDIAKRSHSMVPGHMPESGIPSSSQMRLVGNVEAERQSDTGTSPVPKSLTLR
ncbi:hypothetical protein TNCV_4576261 [Trichonephila clavipes]|nr:hypothetical protein TNCV_4576261 [Trichonephila clavipes]